jgi:hypothetical protein
VQNKVRFPGRPDVYSTSYSYPRYVTLRDHVPAFASVAMHTYPNPVSYGLGAAARRIQYMLVSRNYFSTLGTPMRLGRPILPSDDALPSGAPVVVIGSSLSRREFSGDANVLGKTMEIAGRKYSIIGVAPSNFIGVGTRAVDVWIPVSAGEGLRFAGKDWATARESSWMSVIARLAPGVSPTVAGEQVAAAGCLASH